ncbi:MAG: HD-GYP domain-containing protein [Firmicutes bacterium]|nr:HD-GYP domain-containing protein [Bacillota bacterium]
MIIIFQGCDKVNDINEDRLPAYITDEWQKIVELLTEITGLPTAFIARIKSDRLLILNYCDKRDNLVDGERIAHEEINLAVDRVINKILCDKYNFRSLLSYPLKDSRDKTFGRICLADNKENNFSGINKKIILEFKGFIENHLEVYDLHNKLAENRQELKKSKKELENTVHELHNVVEETVDALGSAVGARDAYTSQHQERVARLSFEIARELDLPGDCCKGIYLAALIHDIGKIKIPIDILSKPSILSELEFELIKTHSEAGYMILNKIEFPWPIADIVMQHHERLDGSGYPEGRSGDDILLQSRIIAVADVVEAMTSHRPYRPALGLANALNEVEKNKGILYDKEVVDSCLDVFRKNNTQVITWMGGNN